LPELEQLRRQYEERGVGFLALSIEPEARVVLAAAQRMNIGSKVAIARSEVLGPLSVNQVPSTVFLSADGLLNAVVSGPKDRAWLERRIQEIVPK
jgi:hypothetical protein